MIDVGVISATNRTDPFLALMELAFLWGRQSGKTVNQKLQVGRSAMKEEKEEDRKETRGLGGPDIN